MFPRERDGVFFSANKHEYGMYLLLLPAGQTNSKSKNKKGFDGDADQGPDQNMILLKNRARVPKGALEEELD